MQKQSACQSVRARERESVCKTACEWEERETQAEEIEREPVLKECCVRVCACVCSKSYANKMRMRG